MENNQNDIVVSRIKELMEYNNLNQSELSKLSGIHKATLSSYLRKDRNISYESLKLLANALNVSTDYLKGNTDIKTDDYDIKKICEYTGLNENIITFFNQNQNYSKILNDIFYFEPFTVDLLNRINEYMNFYIDIWYNEKKEYFEFDYKNKHYKMHSSYLENVALERVKESFVQIKLNSDLQLDYLNRSITELEYIKNNSDDYKITIDYDIKGLKYEIDNIKNNRKNIKEIYGYRK